MSSWVKVSRKLLTSAIASKPEYLAVWMHLILSASYKAGEILVGHQVVRLEPGQLVFGRVKFSQQIGVSEHTLRMALKSLEKLQQITIKSETKYSIISITNWAKYQVETPATHQQPTNNPPATHHNKEIQELQEEDLKHMSSDKPKDAKPAKKEKAPETPYEEILALYKKRLPSLPQIRLLDDARKKAMRGRWQSHPKCQQLEFWDGFFLLVSNSDFLMGRTQKPWNGCCFDWIFNASNFKKIVEGNYNRE